MVAGEVRQVVEVGEQLDALLLVGVGPRDQGARPGGRAGVDRRLGRARPPSVTPDAEIDYTEGVRLVRARTAGPRERAELCAQSVDLYADFANDAAWTDREIPVVVLGPR